ncbi:unnamed protein product [Rhizoctonia solani]|uniref:Uncharacterized protein n=1 Tax=Rhizoctonia solani TaxID=456999 RepID=A0A8H2Y0P5_9AGAM|nr:unnamed protein product [Rhizoctonia solani]CAE6532314.1 unnamed protein product [Rhizoctonia solani]
MSSLPPPQYVLISQCTLPTENGTEGHNSILTHPQTHYQYADDPPTAIPMSLPPDAHVVYLDFDPSNPSQSQVRSASNSIVATNLAVSDAAGASVTEHPRLYVISTGELRAKSTSGDDPKLALHDYKERLSASRLVIGTQSNHSRLETGP